MQMTYAPRRYFICSFMLLSCTAYAIAIVIENVTDDPKPNLKVVE